MEFVENRRKFLKQSLALVGGTAVLGGLTALTGCGADSSSSGNSQPANGDNVSVNNEPVVPEYPFPYQKLDVEAVEKHAYECFFGDIGGCCYGTAAGLLDELVKTVGYPYNLIPTAMFASGAAGYGQQSLCGSLGGAINVIGLICKPDEAKQIVGELCNWYANTELPIYRPEQDFENFTVSGSVNCKDSVTKFMEANGIDSMGDIRRKHRCAGVCADTARKAAELLNIHFGFAEAPVEDDAAGVDLAENEYVGSAKTERGTLKVKVTMDGDKISKIEVLEHSETEGICEKAMSDIPAAIVEKNSTAVDAIGGATQTSEAIMKAVEDALSKIQK